MQTFTLDKELTIFTAGDMKPRLLSFLSNGRELEVDLSRIEEIDTAGLQLLIMLKREASQSGQTVRFVLHSQAVLDILELTNLTATFGDQVVLAQDEGH